MAETTNISWCDATLNFWVGCTKVSTGPKGACEHCYAETWANRWPRYRGTWGSGAPRVQFKHLLAKAMELERRAIAKAAAGGGAFFCFSNSLSDIFDKEVPIEWLAEAFAIMRLTPHVTYLLLTKRPQNIVKRAEAAGGLPANAAIGCTAVTQAEADRDLPWLLAALAKLGAAFAFVSMEPLRELVDISWALSRNPLDLAAGFLKRGMFSPGLETLRRIGWVICGFESGAQAAPPDPRWARSLRDQCAVAGVPFEFKQWGAWHADAKAFTDVHGNNPPPRMKIGPKKSGRLLDGVLHDARPVPA